MNIEELGYHQTPLGELTLRRRVEPLLQNREIFEIKLGEEFLMTSLLTEGEQALSTLGLEGLTGELDVVIGGLGLGYTAVAALENPQVGSLLVIDLFEELIDWHRRGLVPIGNVLAIEPRCELRQGDFFRRARTGFDAADPGRKFDAVLLDIDHSPKHYLDPQNQSFYSTEGLAAVKNQLKPGGAFALWSNDRTDEEFTSHLREIFGEAAAHDVEFFNPYSHAVSANSVYIAWRTK